MRVEEMGGINPNGKRRGSRLEYFAGAAAGATVIKASERRVALVFFEPYTGSAIWSPQDNTNNAIGINMVQGSGQIGLYVEIHGDIVKQPWQLRTDINGRLCAALQVMEEP